MDQKGLTAKSRDLLEVTKRQSVLIDEARVLRRLKDLPRKDRPAFIAKGERPTDQRELFEKIYQEVNRGAELLSDVGRGQDP